MAKTKKNEHDKFYTKREIAAECIQLLDLSKYDLIIEPSAGSGSFSDQLPCVAYDLVPEGPNIIQADWFSVKLPPDKKVLVIGNPPFGRQNSLALAFIKHATKQNTHTIAFILPKSFRKDGVKNHISWHYHLINEKTLPLNAFTLDGVDYPLPCIFQIWERRTYLRDRPQEYTPQLFSFVGKNQSPDLAFRRVGGTAGTITAEWQEKSESTHYFLKSTRAEELLEAICKLPHSTRNDSVGPRSISKNELLKELYEANTSFATKVGLDDFLVDIEAEVE